jgi:hypothetical protein
VSPLIYEEKDKVDLLKYKLNFHLYYNIENVTNFKILCVCKNTEVMRELMTLEQEIRGGRRPRIYFASLERVIKGQRRVSFYTKDRRSCSFSKTGKRGMEKYFKESLHDIGGEFYVA